eukprot:tig00020538_g10339.t1
MDWEGISGNRTVAIETDPEPYSNSWPEGVHRQRLPQRLCFVFGAVPRGHLQLFLPSESRPCKGGIVPGSPAFYGASSPPGLPSPASGPSPPGSPLRAPKALVKPAPRPAIRSFGPGMLQPAAAAAAARAWGSMLAAFSSSPGLSTSRSRSLALLRRSRSLTLPRILESDVEFEGDVCVALS